MKTILLEDEKAKLLREALSLHSGATLRPDWPEEKRLQLTDIIAELSNQLHRTQ